MPALPYLQRPESQSSEKKNYRLSLSARESKEKIWRCRSFLNDEEESQTRGVIDNKTNSQGITRSSSCKFSPDDQNDSNLQLFDPQFTDSVRVPQTVTSPTPSIILKQKSLHIKNSSKRGLPRWVSELGKWLAPKQQLQLYQRFWRHLDLIDRAKEDMLDPYPHVAQCDHSRTKSALQRQRTKMKLEQQLREEQRFERLLERFKKTTEVWESFERYTKSLGDKHTGRLLAFKRTKDQYVDPLEGIRERRERERIEREHQRLLEETRKQEVTKRREVIPAIHITNYDADLINMAQKAAIELEYESEEADGSDYKEIIEDINTKDTNFNELHMKICSPVPSVVTDNVDVIENHGVEKSHQKPMHLLSAPSLSSLDLEEHIIVENNPIFVDDTVGLMTGVLPTPLGMSTGLIPDSSIKASSSCDRYHSGGQGRLNNIKRPRKGGAWCPKKNNDKQYLEIDVGGVATLMQVATQGYPGEEQVAKKDLRWVQSYTLAYSNDGKTWEFYREGDAVKVFEGNSDNNTVVLHSLSTPFDARYVRFFPKTWRNAIAMRVEVYGSYSDDCVSPAEAVNPSPSLPYTNPTPEALPSQDLSSLPPPVSPTHQPPSSSTVLPPPITKPPSPISEVSESVSEVQHFKCSLDKITPLEGWEEETVDAIVQLPSEEEAEDVEIRLSSPFLNVKGSKKASKTKHKPRNPKSEKKEKRKKPPKKKKRKLPEITSGMDALPEVEEEPEPQEEEVETEEEYRIPTPPLPEIQKRPVDVRRPSINQRFQMFSSKSTLPSDEEKKRLKRASGDNSIRDEMLRQQLAEERKKKLLSLTGNRKLSLQSSASDTMNFLGGENDSFIFNYCIISESQLGYYRRIFESFDEDGDGFLFPEEILEALECINKHLLDGSHLKYIYRALEMCDCSLDTGADFKFFSVLAAFSQKIAALDEYAKIIISKLDFRELDYKLQRAKSLYKCYADEATGQMSMELLTLELTVGGLDPATKNHILRTLGPSMTYLDFLDFLTYIPLFIHIHQHVLSQPLHIPMNTTVH